MPLGKVSAPSADGPSRSSSKSVVVPAPKARKSLPAAPSPASALADDLKGDDLQLSSSKSEGVSSKPIKGILKDTSKKLEKTDSGTSKKSDKSDKSDKSEKPEKEPSTRPSSKTLPGKKPAADPEPEEPKPKAKAEPKAELKVAPSSSESKYSESEELPSKDELKVTVTAEAPRSDKSGSSKDKPERSATLDRSGTLERDDDKDDDPLVEPSVSLQVSQSLKVEEDEDIGVSVNPSPAVSIAPTPSGIAPGLMSRLTIIGSSEPAQCQGCEDKVAVSWCRDCNFVFCKDCLDASHKVKTFQKHIILDVGRKPKELDLCQEHRDHKRVWCFTCKDTICIMCATTPQHKGHKTELVAEIADKVRKDAKTLVTTLVGKETKGLPTMDDGILKDIMRINSEVDKFENLAETSLALLGESLDRFTKEILEKVAIVKQEMLAKLWKRKDEVKEWVGRVHEVAEMEIPGDDVLTINHNNYLRDVLAELATFENADMSAVQQFGVFSDAIEKLKEAAKLVNSISVRFAIEYLELKLTKSENRSLEIAIISGHLGSSVKNIVVEYKNSTSESWISKTVSPSESSILIEGLKPATTYVVRAKAEGVEWSPNATFYTSMPKVKVSSANVKDTGLQVHWSSEDPLLKVDEISIEANRIPLKGTAAASPKPDEKVAEEWLQGSRIGPFGDTHATVKIAIQGWESFYLRARFRSGEIWSEWTDKKVIEAMRFHEEWNPDHFSRRKTGKGMKVVEEGMAVEQREADDWASSMCSEGLDTDKVDGIYRWKVNVEVLPKLHNVMLGLADSSHPLEGAYIGKTDRTWALYSEVSATKKDRTLFKYHTKKKESVRGKLLTGDDVEFELRCYAGAKPAELSVKVYRKEEEILSKVLFSDVTGKVYPAISAHTKGLKLKIIK